MLFKIYLKNRSYNDSIQVQSLDFNANYITNCRLYILRVCQTLIKSMFVDFLNFSDTKQNCAKLIICIILMDAWYLNIHN